ncbi:MAG: thioredoxin [Cohaesibacteraceae bacterium]|nr:thioredoxin [Cohaesibacteraceae bacterium]
MSNPTFTYGGTQGYQPATAPASTQAPVTTPASPPAKPESSQPLIHDTTTQGFAVDVIAESSIQTVLVDFWAPWCGPCKQLTPVIEQAVKSAGGRVKLVKMNIEDHPAIAGQLGVKSIPAVIAFRDGKPVDAFMGVVPEKQITEFIEKNSAPTVDPIEEMLDQAKTVREAGDFAQASRIYSTILNNVPDHPLAFAGIAMCLLESGEIDKAAEVIAGVPEDNQDAEIIATRAAIDLRKQTEGLGDKVELEARIAADTDDHPARFDLALLLNALGERNPAADELLTIMKRDREWNDDGARKQLLQFFEAWGMMDAATQYGRRGLSSLLFR